jgi:hypothetical protein
MSVIIMHINPTTEDAVHTNMNTITSAELNGAPFHCKL